MTAGGLTTTERLEAYLTSHGRQPADVQLLPGGTANYVYRVTFKDGPTVIYKHAAPYLHSNKDFAFDPLRMDYENRILQMMALDGEKTASPVHAVRVLSYDRENKLICMEEGGQENLKVAYSSHELDIPKIGEELGRWSATLHTALVKASLGSAQGSPNNEIAVSIYRHSYANLPAVLLNYGHDPKLGKRINDEFGSLLATDNECVCHGDFWPGNVLIRAGNTSAEMTIVDWELVRRGTSATDVGQFAAESFLLDRFRGGKGLRAAFLKAYAATREENGLKLRRSWLKRVAVHWAVHVAFWPTRVDWIDRAGTQELVDIGVAVLTDVLEDCWEGLGNSLLFRDVKEVWKPMFERA
jgi:Ser/Thr protein kinase RdoA (MazF antagonist)